MDGIVTNGGRTYFYDNADCSAARTYDVVGTVSLFGRFLCLPLFSIRSQNFRGFRETYNRQQHEGVVPPIAENETKENKIAEIRFQVNVFL